MWPNHLDAIRRALDRIARTGMAMELNTSGLNKDYPEIGPVMLREMALREIPVVPGSDSHDPHRVGADFDQALAAMQAAGFGAVSYFIDRRRVGLPIRDVVLSTRRTTSVPRRVEGKVLQCRSRRGDPMARRLTPCAKPRIGARHSPCPE